MKEPTRYPDKFSEVHEEFLKKVPFDKIGELGKPAPHTRFAIEHLKKLAEEWKRPYVEDIGNFTRKYEFDPDEMAEQVIDYEYVPEFEPMDVRAILGSDLFDVLEELSKTHETKSKEEYEQKFEEMKDSLEKLIEQIFSDHLDDIYYIHSHIRGVGGKPKAEEERDAFIKKIEEEVGEHTRTIDLGLKAGVLSYIFAKKGTTREQENFLRKIKEAIAKGFHDLDADTLRTTAESLGEAVPQTDEELEEFRTSIMNQIRDADSIAILEELYHRLGVQEMPAELDLPAYPYRLLDALRAYLMIKNREKFYNHLKRGDTNSG